MICIPVNGRCRNCGSSISGANCFAEADIDELLAMQAGTVTKRSVKLTNIQVGVLLQSEPTILTNEEKETLGLSDPTLFGNKIAALTRRLGMPPCPKCKERQVWINNAHLVLKELLK